LIDPAAWKDIRLISTHERPIQNSVYYNMPTKRQAILFDGNEERKSDKHCISGFRISLESRPPK
jgi:hypothetical protein